MEVDVLACNATTFDVRTVHNHFKYDSRRNVENPKLPQLVPTDVRRKIDSCHSLQVINTNIITKSFLFQSKVANHKIYPEICVFDKPIQAHGTQRLLKDLCNVPSCYLQSTAWLELTGRWFQQFSMSSLCQFFDVSVTRLKTLLQLAWQQTQPNSNSLHILCH